MFWVRGNCQHCFWSLRSCETHLVQFVHDVISKLDGNVNRGTQTDRFDQYGFRKGVPNLHVHTADKLLYV